MAEIRVENWRQLHEELFAGSWRPEIERHRSPYVFRGSSLAPRDLLSSLQIGRYERHEHHLLKHFRKYARRTALVGDSVWDWLALAKHHGLPTRLLDWTYSPYVALHFATSNTEAFDSDGVIWCVNFAAAHRMLPPRVRQILDEEEARIFTGEMLSTLASSLREFDQIGAETDFVLFFEPPSLDDRIVNQFALFSVPSRADLKLDEFFSEHPEILRRVVFPASLKWEVRDHLDQANITERVLFPGLDGLASWLKRYYMSR
ncbi:MAG: FRG domain-containing protein [Acidobacteria bacterium]|nr:FRG domain-containing protein [Acidobacteriota bacterium]